MRNIVAKAWDLVPTPVWDAGDFVIQLVFDTSHLARLLFDSATDTGTRPWAEASLMGAEAARLHLNVDDGSVADMVGRNYVDVFRQAESYMRGRLGILGQS